MQCFMYVYRISYLRPPTIIMFLAKFGGFDFLSTLWNMPRGKYIWRKPRLSVIHI